MTQLTARRVPPEHELDILDEVLDSVYVSQGHQFHRGAHRDQEVIGSCINKSHKGISVTRNEGEAQQIS